MVCRALAARGARRIAIEDPSNPEQAWIAARAGLEPVPVPVDDDGLRIDALERVEADAVVADPGAPAPDRRGARGERRAALLGWLRARDAIAIEDDYDAEYPLRPRGGRRAPRPRARPHRLRRLGEQDPRAGAADRLARRAAAPARRGHAREAARRHGDRADRAARVRRLPRARGARPAPAPDARPLPRAARRARRRARRGAARGDGPRHRRPGCTRPSSCPAATTSRRSAREARRRRHRVQHHARLPARGRRGAADAHARLRAAARAGDPRRRPRAGRGDHARRVAA